LQEISRSRPYFISILGERYGWIPDEIPAELIEELAAGALQESRQWTKDSILTQVHLGVAH
jgi:hypothetical protein